MFKPMLACNLEIKKIRLPTMMSVKLEGVRGEFTPNGLRTRPMKRFNNTWLAAHFGRVQEYCMEQGIHLQGEFYKHGLTFSEISSICRRSQHPDTGDLSFHVFDCYFPELPNLTFQQRYDALISIVVKLDLPHVCIAPQATMTDHDKIQVAYENAIAEGYEGLCFKDPALPYKHGRGTKTDQRFGRIKPEDTYDGVVLEIVEQFENLSPQQKNELGYSYRVQDKDLKLGKGMAAVAVTKWKEGVPPVRVTLSLGLTDCDRKEIWGNREDYIGKHIKFVGIPVPGMDQPRSPRFKDWRTDLD